VAIFDPEVDKLDFKIVSPLLFDKLDFKIVSPLLFDQNQTNNVGRTVDIC